MNTSRRQTAKRWLTVVALGSVALTGCSQNSADRMDPAAVENPSASSASDEKAGARSDSGKKSTNTAGVTNEASPSAPVGNADTGSDHGRKSAEPATAAKEKSPSTRTGDRSGSSEAAKNTSAATSRASFAGTEQFVTINKAWTSNGRAYLAVRPAQKKINTRFDTWEIVTGTGAFTTVTMAEDARVLLTTPVRDEVAGSSRADLLPSSTAQFVTLVNRLDFSLYNGIGYDLVFDGAGQVTGLKSLYRP